MTVATDETIRDARVEIDALDAQICYLINSRIVAARKILAVRIAERDYGREEVVCAHYAKSIVAEGWKVRAVAHAILEACRLH